MATLLLSEGREYLNIVGTQNDGEIQKFITRAESAIVKRCGPLVADSATQRVRGERPMLKVDKTPILSLTSVTPVGGSALTVEDLVVERPSAGVVEMLSGGRFASRWYDVVYQCGWGASPNGVPEDLKSGVLELLRHLWDTQRGGGAKRVGSAQSDATANTVPGAAFVYPFRVEQLITPYVKAEN